MNYLNAIKQTLSAAALISIASYAQASDVGVSVSIGEPGFYGRIEVGDYPYPQPRVIYNRPIVIHQHVEREEPIYLRVPPGHTKNWGRYCDRYNACGRPVYFVNDSWYNEVYVPQYRQYHEDSHGRSYYRDEDRNRYDDHRDRENYGRGYGHDEGHGHGHDHGHR